MKHKWQRDLAEAATIIDTNLSLLQRDHIMVCCIMKIII